MDDLDPLSTILIGSSFFLVLVAVLIGFFTFFKKICFQEYSSLSLSSPPPNSSQILKHHDVFPSFHGADVRKNVLSHILESFKRKGINPFIDNNIERSKSIGPELKEAIRAAKIAIVLLSKNYASSSWCLDELAEIMNCREVLDQKVMPIFYEVDPTDIKKQTGDFGNAFRKSCKGKTKENIERWKNALTDVAQIAGEHSRNWENDATMIEKIATNVSHILNLSTPSRDLDDLVGMTAHMEELEQLLCLDLDEVRMIGIWGPPGIGKSTIARYVYHKFSNRFQLGAIMYIKRYPSPCLNAYNTQLELQNQMLSLVLNHEGSMIPHLGVAQQRLRDKKVILVLDEVDHSDQLIALAKEKKWFGPGSRIIITTEDLRVLKAHRIKHIYKVKYPSSEEAFKIFCMNAFGKEYPDDGFYKLACEATNLAGKLPLGLKVLGSALRGMSKQEWKMEMPTLRNCLHGEIESIIKFSYNALSDEEKDLFLYISCFFNFHNDAHKVEVLLAKKFSNIKKSLHVLYKKSFISISPDESIAMHTLLEVFGRETARKQYIHGIKKRRLLVDARDICDDTIDCSKFIAIKLDFKWGISEEELNELNISEKAVERMSDVQFVSIFDRDDGCGLSERLHSLLYHSQKIRYLKWINFQNKSLPATFNTEYLVELHIQSSKLEKLWEGNKPLNCLRQMNLSYSEFLKELPNLSTATNLRRLTIKGCSSLKKLPDLSTATNLEYLDISGCSSLKKLPDLSTATNLEYLDINGCPSLRKLRKFQQSNNLVSPQLSDSLTHVDASDCKSLEILDCSFNNSYICLEFINCFKLNQKARDLIMHTPTSTYAVLPGKHVPTCFNYRATDGGSLTIKLNEMSFPTSLRFQACILLEQINKDYHLYASINIMVRNKEETRDYLSGYEDINIIVKNKCRRIPAKREHIYTFEVEVSEVTSTELVFEFETNDSSNWKVGECGLLQILEVPIMGKRGEKRARNTKEGGKKKRKTSHRQREEKVHSLTIP